jgi:hypothetical protein
MNKFKFKFMTEIIKDRVIIINIIAFNKFADVLEEDNENQYK